MSDNNIALEDSSSLCGSPDPVLTWDFHGEVVCDYEEQIKLLQEEKKSLLATVKKLQDENTLLKGNKQSIFRSIITFLRYVYVNDFLKNQK
jgi:hypothetical protein